MFKRKKRKTSIKTKLILYFSLIVLFALAVMGVLSTNISSNILIREAEETIFTMAKDAAAIEQGLLDKQSQYLRTLASLKEFGNANRNEQLEVLKISLGVSEFDELGVVDLSGNVYYVSGESLVLEKDNSVWRTIETGEELNHFSISQQTGELVLLQVVPIVRNEVTVGALLGRRNGEALSKLVSGVGFGKEGYAYIMDGNGTVIGHPDQSLVASQFNPMEDVKTDVSLQTLATAFEDMLEHDQGVLNYHFRGNHVYAGYYSIEGSDWTLVLTAIEDEFLSAISELQKAVAIATIAILAVAVVITYFIGTSIAKPIILSAKYSEEVAGLDLRRSVSEKFLIRNDEFGILARALQGITDNLRSIIIEINDSSEQLSASSEELTATAQQTATAAQEVAKTIEEIADGAAEQAKSTEEGSNKAIMLGNSLKNVKGYIGTVGDATEQVKELVESGLMEMDSLNQITKENSDAIKEIYDVIIKTNESSNKISEASNVIEAIAAQTNLLSLNAAIEAARAGDAGKGFSVVAEEIRKLAEQSTASTKVIYEIVTELQGNVINAVETMERVNAITSEQSSSVSNSKSKYEMIAEAMKNTIEKIKDLNYSGNEMDQMRHEILEVLQELSAIAEENAASSEEASASTEEQTASVEEIASASDVLTDLAQKLQGLVGKFRT